MILTSSEFLPDDLFSVFQPFPDFARISQNLPERLIFLADSFPMKYTVRSCIAAEGDLDFFAKSDPDQFFGLMDDRKQDFIFVSSTAQKIPDCDKRRDPYLSLIHI